MFAFSNSYTHGNFTLTAKSSERPVIARNTVRKYLRSDGIPERQPRPKRGSKLDPFKPLLDDYIAQGITNCEMLWERIQLQGYTGGKTIGEYIDEQGVLHKVPVFVMVLGYSRAIYVEFAKRCDIRSFLHCLIHALEYFGGVPNVMLTDRMKTVILGMGDDRKPRWHPLFADFAAAIGRVPRVCRARRPQTKVKVGRGVRFVKDNFLPGRTFTDLGDLNAQARRWCDEKNRRVHGTTGERPCDRLPREKLQDLPAEEKLAPFRFETRRVSQDGFVSFDGVRYGVPWAYSGREVAVRLLRGRLEVWFDGRLVAEHSQVHRSRAVVMLPGQYAGLQAAQGHAAARPCARQVPMETVETLSLDLYDRLAEVSA